MASHSPGPHALKASPAFQFSPWLSQTAGGKTREVQTTRGYLSRAIQAARFLARDRRVPKPLRWGAGIALLPIPGPVDEAVLILVAALLFVFCRQPMTDAWRRAEAAKPAAGAGQP